MPEHYRESDIPDRVKWAMTFINRVGFPILAFGGMCYIHFVGLKDQTRAMEGLTQVFIQMKSSIDNNTDATKRMVEAIYRTRGRSLDDR